MPNWSNEQRIAHALSFIPADDRDMWVKMGMACHSVSDDMDLREVWEEWSQTSARYNQRDAEHVWRSFKPGAVTIATLFATARQHGWQGGSLPGDEPTAEQRREITEKGKAERVARRQAFGDWWKRACGHVTVGTSPYLASKGLTASTMLLTTSDDRQMTIVPFVHASKRQVLLSDDACGVQTIMPNGDKRYVRNSSMSGVYASRLWPVDLRTLRKGLVVCEGFATMIALEQACKRLFKSPPGVICVGGASNLAKTGQILASRMRSLQILVVCDNDQPTKQHMDRDVGVSEWYALQSGLRYVMPSRGGSSYGYDFADYYIDQPRESLRWLKESLNPPKK